MLRFWLALEFPLNPADGATPGSLLPRNESLVAPLSRLGLDKGASPGFVGEKLSVSDVLSCAITSGKAEFVMAGIGGANPVSIKGSAAAVRIDFMKASLSRQARS